MQINPPSHVRAILYVITALGTPVVAFLIASNYIGELWQTLWSAEVAVVGALAAFNVSRSDK